MAIKRHLTSLGLAPLTSEAIVGGASQGNLTATGSGQTDAFAIGGGFAAFTTVPASTGARLPVCDPGDEVVVCNLSASQALLVYGQTGESVQGGSANAGFSVAANKTALFKKGSTTAWGAILSA